MIFKDYINLVHLKLDIKFHVTRTDLLHFGKDLVISSYPIS